MGQAACVGAPFATHRASLVRFPKNAVLGRRSRMSLSEKHLHHDNSPKLSLMEEDRLDWLENQARTSDDVRQIDHRFLGGSFFVTLLWIIAGCAVFGGLTYAGPSVIAALTGQ